MRIATFNLDLRSSTFSLIQPIVFQFLLVQLDAEAGFCRNQNIAIAISECFLNDIVLVVDPGDALLARALGRGNRDDTTESHHCRGRRKVNVCRIADAGFNGAVDIALESRRFGYGGDFFGFKNSAGFGGVDRDEIRGLLLRQSLSRLAVSRRFRQP